MKNVFLWTLIFLSSFLLIPVETPARADTLEPARSRKEAKGPDLSGKINKICLYTVANGRVRRIVYAPEDLLEDEEIRVNGYVAGIRISPSQKMTVGVEALKNKAQEKFFRYRNFGTGVNYEQAFENFQTNEGTSGGDNSCPENGYSLFPAVRGEAICPLNRFLIRLKTKDGAFSVPVEQAGYQEIPSKILRFKQHRKGIAYRYLGTRFNKFVRQKDFSKRLKAIDEGIASVEGDFHMDLVDAVNIVDFSGICDAFAMDGRREIWFYADSLQKESLEELKSMAAHETVHRYVYQEGLAQASGVRELFADLKGYGPLSLERFQIVTGVASIPKPAEGRADNDFFFFIDEGNFLKGMTGGHSFADTDEFCASFVHSLMFVDHLKSVFDRPLLFFEKRESSRFLTPKEKRNILDDYVRSTQVFLEALQRRQADRPNVQDRSKAFFINALEKVMSVKREMAAEASMTPATQKPGDIRGHRRASAF